MSTVNDILKVLDEVIVGYPDFGVVVASEKRRDFFHSRIARIVSCGGDEDGDALFEVVPIEEAQGFIPTVREFHARMEIFRNHGGGRLVEMREYTGAGSSEEWWDFHVPIVGARIAQESNVLVFLSWDRLEESASAVGDGE